MTIPFFRKLVLLFNILYWIVTYTLLCLPFYRSFTSYGLREWCFVGYNLGSLMAVFYGLAYFTKQWLRGLSLAAFSGLRLHKKFFYLFNGKVIKILMVIVAYLVVSLVLENEFFAQTLPHGPYQDMPLQFERRLSRIHPFITGGPSYALALFLLLKFIGRTRVLETENKDLHESVYQIGGLYETLKEETAKN